MKEEESKATNKGLWPSGGPEREQNSRSAWATWAGLMLLAAVLRGVALNQQLWYDEITTLLEYVRLPLGQIVTTYTSQNQHLMYSVLARISVLSFGEAAWTLRLPAVMFGVLCVPALYFCARQWVTRREALLASTLLTVSYHHVWFSQNARGYTGLALVTLVSTYCFVRGAREGKAKWWVWYGVAVALGMYVHLSMGFIAAGQGLVYLWMAAEWMRKEGRSNGQPLQTMLQPLLGFVLAGVITMTLYAPVMGEMLARTVGSQTSRGAAEVVKSEWRNPVWLVLETARGVGGGNTAAGLGVLALAGVIVLAGVWSFWKRDRYIVGLIFAPIGVTGVLMFALSRNLWPRFFFFAIGFAFLLIVRGLMTWTEPLRRAFGEKAAARCGMAAYLLILLASCVQLRAAWIYPKQDYAGAMNYVEQQKRLGDEVVLVGLTTVPYQKYYGRAWPQVETPAQLEEIRARGGTTWALYTLPIYVESRYPELWNVLKSECGTKKVFRGTMGGGEIYVCKLEAREKRE